MSKNLSKINILIRFIAIVPVLLAVISCSQLASVNCDPHSWQGQGLRDGLRGTSPRVANEYERTCNQQSIVFDRQAYLVGHKEGNTEYCTAQNGFDLGLSGVESERVCVNEDALAFKDGLNTGRKLRNAVLNLDSSSHPRKHVLGGFTVLHGYSDLSHEASENNQGYVGGARGLNSEVALTSRYANSSDKRNLDTVRTTGKVAKCEEAKRGAEEKGFYTSIDCL